MSLRWKMNLLLFLALIFQAGRVMSFSDLSVAYNPLSHALVLGEVGFGGVEVIQSQIKVTVSGKLALCHHLDRGHIILEVEGGTPPYSFTWNNLEKVQNRYNLFSGTYTVFIKDSKGKQHEERIVIQPPFPLIIEMGGIQDATCSSNADGSAKVNIKFGRGEPYKIEWSHGLKDELEAKDLKPGTYSVKVIDMYNCDATLSFEIKSAAEAMEVRETVESISCSSNSLGSIKLEVAGGQAPYTYSWSNGQTTKDIENLQAGTYSVLIKDNLGCSLSKSFDIKSPEAVEVTVGRVQHNQCFGANEGEIDIHIKGGQAPFTFLWSNGATTQNLRNLSAGTYSLKVKDASGCEITSMVQVSQPVKLSAKIESAIEVNCESGEAVGFAWVSIQGGNGPYTIAWNNGVTGKNEIEFKQSSEIEVEVIDGSGCKVIEKLKVVFPFDNSIANRVDFNVKKLSFSSEPEVHALESLVFESEISEDFIAWEWDFGDGNVAQDKDPVHVFKQPGDFDVVLRAYDIYGCSSIQSRTVTVLEQGEWVTIPNAFSPNGDGLNDYFKPVFRGVVDFEMNIFNYWGEHLYSSQSLEDKGWDGVHKGSLLPRGNYIYRVAFTTISGEKIEKTGTVTIVR